MVRIYPFLMTVCESAPFVKIAVLDDYQACVRKLVCFSALAGHEVLVFHAPFASEDALVAALADCEAVVLVRERTKFPATVLRRLPKLKLLSQTGRAGPHIDEAVCKELGIQIAVGSGSPTAPAELTWALILGAMRGIAHENAALKAGKWQTMLGTTLKGRTLGILGYGNIGRIVAGFGKAFGMPVLAYGRASSAEKAAQDGVPMAASQRELFERSDVLSVHVKLSPETRGLVTAADLAAMKASALFVNTSRAELVVAGALLAALNAGHPGMAGVDVYESEPTLDNPLIHHPRVLALPHLGYVEKDSYEMYFGTAFANVIAYSKP
jgi:D-3-phosphoglycerate dehydrogenase / 2-oxoglutarate reductase